MSRLREIKEELERNYVASGRVNPAALKHASSRCPVCNNRFHKFETRPLKHRPIGYIECPNCKSILKPQGMGFVRTTLLVLSGGIFAALGLYYFLSFPRHEMPLGEVSLVILMGIFWFMWLARLTRNMKYDIIEKGKVNEA